MLFISLNFAIFFPTVCLCYFLTPFRFRWMILLAASYFFYMSWKLEYGLLLLSSTLIDYYVALRIESATSQRAKRNWLTVTLLYDGGLLFVFKYFNFFNTAAADFMNLVGVPVHPLALSLLLPIGISFHTFQSVSYVVDVYRGTQRAERHLGYYALFVGFFPQMVAGPIERARHLLTQLRYLSDPEKQSKVGFNYSRIVSGIRLVGWGVLKKVVIADNVVRFVDPVFANTAGYGDLDMLLVAYLFGFQVYFDFSAYTDIARGCARILGFDIIENFRLPFLSRSIPEFWSRWHMSLTGWFRDYVFMPLSWSGDRTSRVRMVGIAVIVFLSSGLWHGANWTYVVFGAYHGAAFLTSIALSKLRLPKLPGVPRLPKGLHTALQVFVTYNIISLAWIIFRSTSITQAGEIFHRILLMMGQLVTFQSTSFSADSQIVAAAKTYPVYFLVMGALIVLFETVEWLKLKDKSDIGQRLIGKSTWKRWSIYYAMAALFIFLRAQENVQFIYFQF
jgi:D-alanyl-lipoteichoic acid acyltransferase DltB (MBOAT superfamily)